MSAYKDHDSRSMSISSEEGYWINEIHLLVSSCYNEATHEFDWKRYWKEYTDLLIETPQREKYLKSELRSVAFGQINYIYYHLSEEYPDETERFIKDLSWTIIVNIPVLYGEGDPAAVAFRDLLSDIKSLKTPCDAQTVRRLKELIEQMKSVVGDNPSRSETSDTSARDTAKPPAPSGTSAQNNLNKTADHTVKQKKNSGCSTAIGAFIVVFGAAVLIYVVTMEDKVITYGLIAAVIVFLITLFSGSKKKNAVNTASGSTQNEPLVSPDDWYHAIGVVDLAKRIARYDHLYIRHYTGPHVQCSMYGTVRPERFKNGWVITVNFDAPDYYVSKYGYQPSGSENSGGYILARADNDTDYMTKFYDVIESSGSCGVVIQEYGYGLLIFYTRISSSVSEEQVKKHLRL